MKFLIFCYPRTGSSLICEALNQHPSLTCGLEVFNVNEYKYAEWRNQLFQKCFNKSYKELIITTEQYGIKEILFDTINYDYREFLFNVYEKFNGFKVIANHINNESEIWNQLDDVKYIFLKRDVYEACYSWHCAIQNKLWHIKKNEKIKPINVNITNQEIEAFEKYFIKSFELIKNKTSNSNSILLDYSEINSDWEKTCFKLCEFLNVPKIILPRVYKKINKKKFL